ncbi:MAG: hypothetical protein IJY62_06730 [Clostridia bacterium]|nr:hypothetical protein [Clostridia bacterium]
MDKINEQQNQGAASSTGEGIVLPPSEAEEYCLFKRQKRMAEVGAAFARAELEGARGLTLSELKRLSESAKRVGAAAVRTTPNFIGVLKSFLAGSAVLIDCAVGGTGETTAKVKAYETKQAVKSGAGELTLTVCGSNIKNGRYGEVKKEIKKVVKAARKGLVKKQTFAVKVSAAGLGYEDVLRLARLVAECGGKFLSVPFFAGAETLKRDMQGCCMLEVTGVETAADYKILVGAGVESICLENAESVYNELMREAQDCNFTVPVLAPFIGNKSDGLGKTNKDLSGGNEASGESKYDGVSRFALASAPFGIAKHVAERHGAKKEREKQAVKAEQTSILDALDLPGNKKN